jgi:hypothetical protein
MAKRWQQARRALIVAECGTGSDRAHDYEPGTGEAQDYSPARSSNAAEARIIAANLRFLLVSFRHER